MNVMDRVMDPIWGAIVGDIVGSRFEFDNIHTKDFEFLSDKCYFTDDTCATLAVCEMCLSGDFSQENVFATFARYVTKYPGAGWGGRFYTLMNGGAIDNNSCGNGAPMRISPVPVWAVHKGKGEEDMLSLVDSVTKPTHSHPEALKAAHLVARCIYRALSGATKPELVADIDAVYPAFAKATVKQIGKDYGFVETCQGSVPQALVCFREGADFEDTVRNCISIGGDCDTTADIAGAVAAALNGVPAEIKERALTFLYRSQIATLQEFRDSLG